MRKVLIPLTILSLLFAFTPLCKSSKKRVRKRKKRQTVSAPALPVAPRPTTSTIDMRMTAGNQGGTYYQIATTLNSLPGLKISVWETNGSTENINIISKGKAELALTQLDVLQDMVRADKSLGNRVKIIIPLFTEEVHIIATKKINRIEDLKGKKVSIGPQGSGTRASSITILQKYGISVKDFQADNSKAADGLEKLKKGEIDALIIVAGAPVPLLKKLDSSFGDKFHLVNFRGRQYRKLKKQPGYNKAVLRKTIYRWVSKKARTISIDSAIVGKADLADSQVEALIKKVFDKKNYEELFLSHEKWQELNIRRVKKRLRKGSRAFHPAAVRVFNAM